MRVTSDPLPKKEETGEQKEFDVYNEDYSIICKCLKCNNPENFFIYYSQWEMEDNLRAYDYPLSPSHGYDCPYCHEYLLKDEIKIEMILKVVQRKK